MAKYNLSQSQDSDIGELVRKAESDFTSGTTHVSKYVDMSLYEDINQIYAYLESKHISGDTDSQGREKPFFNIVLAARNIWFRATDIDRSNIKIRSTKRKDDIGAFLATILLQDWMRRENFGVFLNAWGLNSSAFNESILKFVEQDGKLIPSVVPWSRAICDQIDFANNVKIEALEFTEAQLRKNKAYDKELVKELCDARVSREMVSGENKDNKSDYIKVYEVHGELPRSFLTGNEEDEDEYVQQMHVISFLASKDEGKFDDYTLYKGKEKKDPYELGALLPEIDGSIALRGAVKTLFDAQWMQNHTVKSIKDQLDLASKIIFQTSDATFVGQNALSAIQNGDILIHKTNEPLTQLNNTSHDITSQQNFAAQWKQLGNEITGISEQMLGVPAKSGTAWRQVESLLQESHSLFELMTENKGLVIENILRKHVIPFLKTKLDNADEVAAILKSHDIDRIDAKYIKASAIKKSNQVVREKILNDELVTPEEQASITQGFEQEAQAELQDQGNVRYFAPDEISWKEQLKDLEWDVECDVTNESMDKEAFTTINTLITLLADPAKAAFFETPRGKFLFNKALEMTGAVSTIELASIPLPPPVKSEPPPEKISKSISYKDLPPDGQAQLAKQAGINIQPPQPQGSIGGLQE